MLQFASRKKESNQKTAGEVVTSQVSSQRKRTFKTAWFAKYALKTGIIDADLCAAVKEVMQGQCSDLGGGVFKKRLKKNEYRSIILMKGGNYWIYAYLFAKSDRDNISANDLDDFRSLAKVYGKVSSKEIDKLIQTRELTEICHEDQAQVQH